MTRYRNLTKRENDDESQLFQASAQEQPSIRYGRTGGHVKYPTLDPEKHLDTSIGLLPLACQNLFLTKEVILVAMFYYQSRTLWNGVSQFWPLS